MLDEFCRTDEYEDHNNQDSYIEVCGVDGIAIDRSVKQVGGIGERGKQGEFSLPARELAEGMKMPLILKTIRFQRNEVTPCLCSGMSNTARQVFPVDTAFIKNQRIFYPAGQPGRL